MRRESQTAFVETIKERCKMCYTCVRECPAKAIRIVEGQAEVMGRRCVTCGNCVRTCSQKAKRVQSSIADVEALLAGGKPVAALVAPSFPAEFTECHYTHVVGMLRALGFSIVGEVAFGADLVARWYRRLLEQGDGRRYISTACPAVVAFVEKYHPDLAANLAPVVSPMVATARALRRIHGPDVRMVFVGPCFAKKAEAASLRLPGEVDEALSFAELRELLQKRGLSVIGDSPRNVKGGQSPFTPSEFDAPRGGLGALFPISRGMLQAAGIDEDLMTGAVVATEGRTSFVDALKEFELGHLDTRLLEVLACQGCIVGPGMTRQGSLFSNRSRVGQYVRERRETFDEAEWRRRIDALSDLDLSRAYAPDDQRIEPTVNERVREILARLGKAAPEDELNCGACGYDTCREHAVAIDKNLAESEMCLPYTIDQLRRTVKDLAVSSERLASTQAALIQSEKMASMGQLAAGIAHEVNNPLGIVVMYAHLLRDALGDRAGEKADLDLIIEQADRCKKIVSGLLHFARQSKSVFQPVDVRRLVEDALRVLPPPKDVTVHSGATLDDATAELDRDQIIQVVTNLVTNAYAAMSAGGALSVRVAGDDRRVGITVSDTGVGIPAENRAKIFEPFFTTKQMGKGTGLGLAVTYGIVKMHRGDIHVESNADPSVGPTGSTFTVTLPRREQHD